MGVSMFSCTVVTGARDSTRLAASNMYSDVMSMLRGSNVATPTKYIFRTWKKRKFAQLRRN
jgi:hypothetical protein